MPRLGLFAYINETATATKVAIKDGKLVLSKANTNPQAINVEYKNETNKLVEFETARLYVPGTSVTASDLTDVEVNPLETKKLGFTLSIKASSLTPGEYAVRLLLDGELQEEKLTLVILDNDTAVKEVTVAGVKVTGTTPFNVTLPLGVNAEDVTVKATDITLVSARAQVIDFTKVNDETYTFKVKAEDETESALQTIKLVETTIDASASSVSVAADADGNTLVTVTVVDTSGDLVKGLAESVFTVKAGASGSEVEVDIVDFVALVGSHAGTYEITVEGDITSAASVLVDVDGVEF